MSKGFDFFSAIMLKLLLLLILIHTTLTINNTYTCCIMTAVKIQVNKNLQCCLFILTKQKCFGTTKHALSSSVLSLKVKAYATIISKLI